MTSKDELVARIFLRSALPLIKVVAEESAFHRRICPRRGVLQFSVRGSDLGAHILFSDGPPQVVPGLHEKPDCELSFLRLKDLNLFFGGRLNFLPPVPHGLLHLHLAARTLPLLLALKMLMPNVVPKDPAGKALKVKLVLYMITNALSQLNRAGDEGMAKLTKNSPDRIFQWTVKDGPAAYLRIKNGRSKAGRGTYLRRRPFVHMLFPDIEGALKVLTSQVPLVEAVKLGYVATEGAMEYSKEIGYQMQRIEEMTTSL